MREWLQRLLDWFRRDGLERDLKEELRHHRGLLERDAQVGGAATPDALHQAQRRMGSELRVREEARERWSLPMVEQLLQDLRHTLRGIRRAPAFSATVIVTLGLGIGANTAMFSVIDQLMFRPFPYLRDAGQVNRVYLQTTTGGKSSTHAVYQYTRYLALRRLSHTISHTAGYAERALAVGSGQSAVEYNVAGVSASFFDFFDARPQSGRFFAASEDTTPRGASVVVLGHSFWQSVMGSQDVIGHLLQVGNETYTIIGVAPKGFVGVSEGAAPAVFIPITTFPVAAGENKTNSYYTDFSWDWMGMLVRRRAGVNADAASEDLSQAYRLSRREQRAVNPAVLADSLVHPRAVAGAVKTTAGPDAGLESMTLLWVTGVAVIVLCIACANVTNLMFARVLRRRREVAVRLALGVSRRRLVMQFVTESLVLSLMGCAAGLAVAQWGGASLRALVSHDGMTLAAVADWRTLVAASLFAVVTGFATAVGPALLALREDLAGTLRTGVREGTYQRSRMRTVLLVAQSALSVVLLVGAGLFVRSLARVQAMPLGYEPERVLIVNPEHRGLAMDSTARVAFRRRFLAAAQAIPGVQYAARVNSQPFGTNITGLWVPGIDSVQRLGRFTFQVSTPDYFAVMGTRIVRGRALDEHDDQGGMHVAVVSASMARVLWPGRDALGQCLQVSFDRAAFQPGFDHGRVPCTTVVGIAEDATHQSMTDDAHLMYYLPLEQVSPDWGGRLFLRISAQNIAAMSETVRKALQKQMPGQGYVTVEPLESLVDKQRRSWRLGATMFVAFGVLALLVAAVGLYGVIAYNVEQRGHELGVRMALGAQSSHVVRLVVSQGMGYAGAGVLAGILLAVSASRWLQPLLFQQSARDPVTYAAVALTLLLVALLASAVPALRASRTDPNVALRSD